MAKGSTLQVTFTVDGDGKVKAALSGVASDADKSSKSIDNLSKELQTLNERVDKNAGKTNQLARDRAVLDASLQKGLITQREYNTLLGKSTVAYDGLITKARLAAAVLGGIVVAGVTAIFKATVEAEKVQAQLASGIADTGGAAQRTLPQLNALAEALQHATAFDDEAIGGVEQVLLTFRNIQGINFDKATASVLDLSTKLGIDLNAAAIQVGKAMNDPILGVTALGRAGVQFTEDQKKVIKALVDTGDVAGAQTIILKELEAEMGTSAEAARNTLGGALQGVKNDFENLLEGDSGSEGIKGAIGALNEMSDTMNDQSTKDGFAAVVEGLIDVAEFAAKAISALGGVGVAIRDALSQDSDKTYLGLLHKRASIEDDITRSQSVGGQVQNMLGGESGLVHPFDAPKNQRKTLQAALDDVDKQIAARLDQLRLGGLPKPVIITSDSGSVANSALRHPRKLALGTGDGTATGDATGASAADAAHRAAAEAARQQAAAEKALQDEIAAVSTAHGDFETQLEDLQATMAGPLAQAQLAYNRKLDETRALAAKGEVSTTDLAKAEQLLAQQLAQETDAIKRRMDPAADLIKQLDEELRLRTLNNAEARAAVDIAHLAVPATKEEAAAILERYKALDRQQDAADAMDAFRDSSKSAWMAYSTGAESAGEAGKHFFADLADRLYELAVNAIWKELFGEQGSAGGGSAGGWLSMLFGGGGGGSSGSSGSGIGGFFSSLFGGGSNANSYTDNAAPGANDGSFNASYGSNSGSGGGFWGEVAGLFSGLFGGGRAGGGEVQAGHFYRVNEMRPELLEVGGSTWLMMGGQGGRVHPNRDGMPSGRGGDTYHITVPVEGRVDRHTRSQIARDTADELRRSTARR